MRRLFFLLTIALIGCTAPAPPPAIPPLPSTPPMPIRLERFARVTGSVADPAGSPVASAVVRLWGAGASCEPVGPPQKIETDHRGIFATEVTFGPGDDIQGCIVVEALAGGATGREQSAVVFSLSEEPNAPNRAQIDIRLDPPQPLDRAEADRVIGLLNKAMRSHDPEVNRELLPYVRVGMSELWGILTDHAYLLRGIVSTDLIDSGANSFTYRLHGANGKTITTTVTQNVLTELTNPIVQHGSRARTLLRNVFSLVRSGDTARLAAVLSTDVARARDLAYRLRTAFDLPTAPVDPELRLESVDEAGRTLRYRIVATSSPASPDEIIELGYSDQGALWLRM